MQDIANNIKVLYDKIGLAAAKNNRIASDVEVVAVSKTVDIVAVEETLRLGITNFGENRVQELTRKISALPHANWHMIGRLQTNKVKDVIGKVVLIHSLDRWNLAEALNKRAEYDDIDVPVLLQVNVSGEEQKAGIKPQDIRSFLESVIDLPRLRILGFMTMAPEDDNPENARPYFRELNALKIKFSKEKLANVNLKHLSMGMSQDYEVAIEEGATIIRVGSLIFGKR
ncbi:MAG: YggS family pyridoxal phosphate-dependent enzyme [Syntrophomonadaceae bacterium]|nr:YggS family pyridoxal phosphate-dependent enzyme [Syntrophomonadaceae bacterium]